MTGNGTYPGAAEGISGTGSMLNGACSESEPVTSHSRSRPALVPILPQPSGGMAQPAVTTGTVLTMSDHKPAEVPGQCGVVLLLLL